MPNPTLWGVQTSVTFLENTVNATPQVLDSDVSFNDVDNNFNGGTVRVTGLLAEDRVAVGTGGLISVSGSNVLYNGGIIGSFTGGVGNAFTVTLNGSATSVAVDALIQNLTYGNVSDTPTASRTLTINVFDAAGGDAQSAGTWSNVTGAGNNPFHFAGDPVASSTPNGFDAGTNAVPVFIDLDKDGDRDVVAATGLGELVAYFNNGNGTYTPQTTFFNGGAGLGLGFAAATAVDWDGDGDQDLLVGGGYGEIRYFRHDNGSTFVEDASAVASLVAANASIPIVSGYEQSNRVAFVLDYDGDGDLDVMMGGYDPGTGSVPMRTFRHDGAGFTYMDGSAGKPNPFGGIITDHSSAATLIDYDRDGDQDIVLQSNTSLRYFQNNGPSNFVELTGAANPFNGLTVAQGGGGVAFFDHDGDNDQDILVGLGHGGFQYLRNNATHGQTITVNVTAEVDNTAPTIDLNPTLAGTGNAVNYIENGVPLRLATGNSTVSDAESPNFDTGTLTISYSANGSADDRLAIDAGSVSVTGNAVFYGGVQFGTFTGGTGTTPLVFTFDADATAEAVQSLLRQIVYSNVSDTPSTSVRQIDFVLTDGDGGTSATATATVNVTAVDDLPVAVTDTPTADANAVTNIAVIANDTDPDGGTKAVVEINGGAVSIGIPVTLASGARVTLNADGTIGYDPNGQFDDLVSLATSLATGASNFSAVDSFSYTLNGGSSTTVSVTVFGVDEPGDELLGTLAANGITGTAGGDIIWGFEDNDLLQGSDGNDVLYGNDGVDVLVGGANDDRLYGGNGNDLLQGGDGNDVLIGNLGGDTMSGGLGDDAYYVDDAGDMVSENLNEGTDTVRSQIDYTLTDNVENLFIGGAARSGTGNALDNTLHGSESSNTLSGVDGDDTLRGNGGRDTLLGGAGEDTLDGGAGKDTMTGGADRDVFQFRDGDMGGSRPLADLITDFSQADSEKIHLGLVDADTGTGGDQAFAFVGTAAFTGTAGELRYQVMLGDTWISADVDGDGNADWFIGLTGVHALTASDFVL